MAHNLTCSEEAGKVVLALRVPQSQHLADRPLIVFVETLVVPRGILKGCQKRGVIWDVFLRRATRQQRARPERQRKRKGPCVIRWGLCNRCHPKSYCSSVTFISPLSCLNGSLAYAFRVFSPVFLWIKEWHRLALGEIERLETRHNCRNLTNPYRYANLNINAWPCL